MTRGGPRPGAGRPRRHRERLVVELRSPDARALEAAAAAIGVTPQVLAARILEASGPVLRLALHHGMGGIKEIPARGEIYPLPWATATGPRGEP